MWPSCFIRFSWLGFFLAALPSNAHAMPRSTPDAAQEKAEVIEYFQNRVTYYQRDNRTPSLKAQIEEVKKEHYALLRSDIDALLIDAVDDRVLYLVTLPTQKEREMRSLLGTVTAVRKTKGHLESLELDEMKAPAEIIKLVR